MLVSPLVVTGHRNGLQNCRQPYVIAIITIQIETLERRKKYLSFLKWCFASKMVTVNCKYRVRQKYLTILQNSCEWNRWHGEFVLERPSSETQSISVAMECWSVEHWAFAVETYFKNNDSVLTQRTFRRHFNIHLNECP